MSGRVSGRHRRKGTASRAGAQHQRFPGDRVMLHEGRGDVLLVLLNDRLALGVGAAVDDLVVPVRSGLGEHLVLGSPGVRVVVRGAALGYRGHLLGAVVGVGAVRVLGEVAGSVVAVVWAADLVGGVGRCLYPELQDARGRVPRALGTIATTSACRDLSPHASSQGNGSTKSEGHGGNTPGSP